MRSWPTPPAWRSRRWPSAGPPSPGPTSWPRCTASSTGVRFASPDERIAVAERTADLALAQSLLVSAPELHHTPERLRRADGTSRFRAKGHEVYTTATLLEAEARLLEAGRQVGGPAASMGTVAVGDRGQPARPGPSAQHRSGAGRGADRHLGALPRRAGRPGRDGQVHHHGRAPGGVGSRARSGLGARAWPPRPPRPRCWPTSSVSTRRTRPSGSTSTAGKPNGWHRLAELRGELASRSPRRPGNARLRDAKRGPGRS